MQIASQQIGSVINTLSGMSQVKRDEAAAPAAEEDQKETASQGVGGVEQKESAEKEGRVEANEPTEQDLARDRQLAERDREVRAHEQAHLSVGGPYTGRASFTYERGSDGVNYAVAGEVSVDTSAVPNDPQATLEKAEVIRRAALAPAEPSAQDQRIAAEAASMAAEARTELAAERAEEASKSAEGESQSNELHSRYQSDDEVEPGASIDLYA